jgi:hypothetical protein
LGDGIVDKVTVLFSESLATTTLKTNWTLAGIPSGGTLTTVAASTATVTLTLSGTVIDTTVGSFTIALAADPAGVKDSLGNQSAFAAIAPIDGAGPAVTTVNDTDGAVDGKIEPGDSVSFALSEPLGPTVTLPSTVTLTFDDPVGGITDNVLIPGILSGARGLTSQLYVVTDGTSAMFDGSTVLLSADRMLITVTVGPTCTGTACGAGLGTEITAHTFSVLLDPALRDQFGVAPPIVAKNRVIRLF